MPEHADPAYSLLYPMSQVGEPLPVLCFYTFFSFLRSNFSTNSLPKWCAAAQTGVRFGLAPVPVPVPVVGWES
jgi:hypothetical protein